MEAIASQIHFRFPIWWLFTFRRSKIICILNFDKISQFTAEIYLEFLKTNCRHIEIYFCVSTLTFSLSAKYDSASAYHISSESDDWRRSYDVMSTFQDGGHTWKSASSFWFNDIYFRRWTVICVPKFDKIILIRAEILLLSVSSLAFRPHRHAILLRPKCYSNRTIELWRHADLPRWRPRLYFENGKVVYVKSHWIRKHPWPFDYKMHAKIRCRPKGQGWSSGAGSISKKT